MLPDRVSNPGPDLRVRCPTNCAMWPGLLLLSDTCCLTRDMQHCVVVQTHL